MGEGAEEMYISPPFSPAAAAWRLYCLTGVLMDFNCSYMILAARISICPTQFHQQTIRHLVDGCPVRHAARPRGRGPGIVRLSPIIAISRAINSPLPFPAPSSIDSLPNALHSSIYFRFFQCRAEDRQFDTSSTWHYFRMVPKTTVNSTSEHHRSSVITVLTYRKYRTIITFRIPHQPCTIWAGSLPRPLLDYALATANLPGIDNHSS
ncbi:hypothetical protein J6590_034748 [Homalodisca vitripennis]|nr:hypothetical protein J6590_034748 [Homalodisca vitripennis]